MPALPFVLAEEVEVLTVIAVPFGRERVEVVVVLLFIAFACDAEFVDEGE